MSGSADQVLSSIVSEFFSPLYQLAAGVTVLYFLYGAAKYVIDLNNPEKQTFGRSHLLWGTVGLFVVLSVGGILKMIDGIFGGMFK